MLTNFVMMILVRNCWGCCMSLRWICSLSVQSLKHLRKKNKIKFNPTQGLKNRLRSKNPTKSHTPEQREERRTCAWIRPLSREKELWQPGFHSAQRPKWERTCIPAPPRQFAQLSTTYWPAQNIWYQPDSPLSHPVQKTTHQSIIPGASQPNQKIN
jgi:hypothetical protein